MTAYYNEIDPYAAQWLRNLILAGHIAYGDVDTRSIEDVTPNDLRGYAQCHFFAGIGAWSYALRRAGWADDRPVWTGSCPCQPFSAAGKGAGFADERHLWPSWHYLIEKCRPGVLFGEQVASRDAEPWLDLVQTDLEAVGYAFGAVAFPAAGIGAPHIRDRAYWVAYADDEGPQGRRRTELRECAGQRVAGARMPLGGLADAEQHRSGRETTAADHGRAQTDRSADQHGGHRGASLAGAGPTNGHWRAADWLACRDGKWRPVEPGTFPLAHGAAQRVGRLRAYGNAIVAAQAEEFIRAAMSCMP